MSTLFAEAVSAGVAHVFLGMDSLIILLATGALRSSGADCARVSLSWTTGHCLGLAVLGSHALPFWRDLVEWSMYISGLLIIAFGVHVMFWQHLHSDAVHTWEAGWAERYNKPSIALTTPGGRFHWISKQSRRPAVDFIGSLTPATVAVTSSLGMLQGLTSPDVAFTSGSAWDKQSGSSRPVLYAAFCVAIAICACMVCVVAWCAACSVAPPNSKSPRSDRTARRSIGIVLCALGFVWLCLMVQIGFQIAQASHQADAAGASAPSMLRGPGLGKDRLHVQCPMNVSVDGVSLGSVPSWDIVAKLDPWWTEDLIMQYARQPFCFRIGVSKVGGCGVIAAEDLPAGTRVGLVGILSGPWDTAASLVHVTPWLGIAVNHCGHGNAQLRTEGRLIMLDTMVNVGKGQEITFDYNKAAESIAIERAQHHWSC